MELNSLATIGGRVGDKFAKLVVDTNRGHYSGSIREILIDQKQRFRLWADNIGLCSYGHQSLDYRCRDAPKVYEYARQLLRDLEGTLDSIVDERNFMQIEAETMSHELEEETEGLDLVDMDNVLEGEQFIDDEAPQELDEPLATLASDNVRDTIDRLYRLSFRIRNPATRLGFSKAKHYRLMAEDGTDLMESFIAIDLKHVDDLMAKHLKMPPEESRNHFLVRRLARADTNRRQQFGLWRRHRMKVEKSFERTGGSKKTDSHNDPDTISQQIPNTRSQPSTATRIDASKIRLDDSQSIFSSSICTSQFSEDQERKIIIPRLPDEVRGKDFECPYCYILCPGRISDGSAWRLHVFRDLRPYICTYENCTEADQQYDSITDWIAHEYYNHKNPRQYPGSRSPDDSLASQQEDASRPLSLNDVCRKQCPICEEEEPSVGHVSRHLRKIAAFALPRSTIFEDDIPPGSQDSNNANLEFDDDSSKFELEDAEDVSYEDSPPTSFPRNQNQQYHAILGPDARLHSNQPPNQPIDTSNLGFCRVLHEITPENKPPTRDIDLEAKPQAEIQDGARANTMTTLAATRENVLSSDAVKQLDHSSQTGLSIRDYLSNLDYDGSEQNADQRSEVVFQQASVSESLASSRPDGYDLSQPPDDRIVESQFLNMMKKQNWQAIPEEAKRQLMAQPTKNKWLLLCQERLTEQRATQREMTLAQSTSVTSRKIPKNLSLYVQIDPDYGGQPIRHEGGGYWIPPNRPNGLRNGQGPILSLHWIGGRITVVPANDHIRAIQSYGVYRAATVFTQSPDTPNLLAVPFNARTRSVQSTFERGWQAITFNHNQVQNSNSNAYFSYISSRGGKRRIAAPGSHWMPQLLPDWYNCNSQHATRTQAGLIGELPLLFALAAFSAPPHSLGVLLSSMQPGEWMSHGLSTGRIAERGMAVTVYLDPLNPQWSTPGLLDNLQDGIFGPFYGP